MSSFQLNSAPFVPLPSVLMARAISRGLRLCTSNIRVRSLLSASWPKTEAANSTVNIRVARRLMLFLLSADPDDSNMRIGGFNVHGDFGIGRRRARRGDLLGVELGLCFRLFCDPDR